MISLSASQCNDPKKPHCMTEKLSLDLFRKFAEDCELRNQYPKLTFRKYVVRWSLLMSISKKRQGLGTPARASSVSVSFTTIARILRTVPDENAFYFYKTIDYYLDVRARNLDEFLEQLKSIDPASIEFHISRHDFGKWFVTTLGDATLARSVSTLSDTNLPFEQLRERLISLVQMRVARLRKFLQ